MSIITKTKQIDADVLNVLAEAQCDGSTLKIHQQLDRKLYVAVNDVLTALGGAWNKKAKAHVFEGDAADAIESAVLTGSYSRTKQDFGFFETPEPVVSRIISLADLQPGLKVLEPSAGRGRIADAAQAAGCEVTVCEILDANFSELVRKNYVLSRKGDFLTIEPTRYFDRVLMNPPFAARADIHHITHAFKFLKPGGKLVAIASSSVSFRSDRLGEDFRRLVADHGGEIEPLPEGSFKESGTMVNTVIVTMQA